MPCIAPISKHSDTLVNSDEKTLKAGFAGARVLVTGGLGFIGSNRALRLCESGAAVTLLDNLELSYGGNWFNIAPIAQQVQVVIGDTRDERLVRRLLAGQDYLFNLAGQISHIDSMQDPLQDLEANVRAQFNVLEACRKLNPGGARRVRAAGPRARRGLCTGARRPDRRSTGGGGWSSPAPSVSIRPRTSAHCATDAIRLYVVQARCSDALAADRRKASTPPAITMHRSIGSPSTAQLRGRSRCGTWNACLRGCSAFPSARSSRPRGRQDMRGLVTLAHRRNMNGV